MPDLKGLAETIQTVVAPDTWKDAGGPGAIRAIPDSYALAVLQTRDVHDQVLRLLRELYRRDSQLPLYGGGGFF
jgi:hypothetical protein